MNLKLIAVAIAITGLAACSPDVTPESSSAPSAPAASSAPDQPASGQQTGQPDQSTTAPGAADEEKKDEGAVPAVESSKDESEKKPE